MKSYWNALSGLSRLAVAPQGGGAQDYPQRPIRFVNPYAAGGPGDVVARLIAQQLTERWKQPVNVENVTGAGGTLGTGELVKAPADGYTWAVFASPHVINASVYTKLPFDPVRDFQGVNLMMTNPNILIVNRKLPVNSFQDLIALAQARPGTLTYASGGTGTPGHLAAELVKTMAGVDIRHLEYKGHAPAGAAVLKGEADMLFDAILLALPEIKSGHVKALGVTSAKRSSVAPDVPSIAECGIANFDFSPGIGVMVRAGTPAAIVDHIHGELTAVVNLPEVRSRFTGDGAEIVCMKPGDFAVYIETEVRKWAQVVQAAGIPRQ